jgi:hypothetical protein
MTALLRYQAALLLRSNRWIFPLIAYGALVAVGAAASTPLAEGLDWSAAMLVPAVAFITRSMLVAEPDASRAVVAAAAGPLLTSEPAGPQPQSGVTDRITATIDHPAIFLAGLVTAVVCLFVGAAAGTLCNPPLLRHPGAAALATLAVVIVALAANVSPANAALRSDIASNTAARWPGAVSLIAAAVLLAVTWTASAMAAARRERSLA